MTVYIEKKHNGNYKYLAHWFADGYERSMFFHTIKDIKEYTHTWSCNYTMI